jgi:MscS family membrane protein
MHCGHLPTFRPSAWNRPMLTLAMLVSLVAGVISPNFSGAQDVLVPVPRLSPLRTDSPRETLSTFLRLSADMEAALVDYTTRASLAGAARLALLSDQMVALIDLRTVASASRREVGIQTATYLMDVFGRLPPLELATVPDEAMLEGEESMAYRIDGTPIRIVRIAAGERQGEYLFGASTIQAAPRFLRAVENLPLRTRLDTDSYSSLSPQLAGPLIPAGLVKLMPEPLRTLWLGTPIWKVVAMATYAAALFVIIAWLQSRLANHVSNDRLRALARQAVLPLAILAVASWALPFAAHQINVSGGFAKVTDTVRTLLGYMAYAWLFWMGARMTFEWVIRSPRIPDESLDANLLRLVGGVIGIVGAAVILAFGGQAIGLPIMSVLAGLGIGGLAVALALRPTMENLVGGVMLYIDRPVRVGDFCSFGTQMGTVEGIGLRSTKLRALDRTLITVPNAQFADMEIINWAACDQMLIQESIGLRYETKPDQLRYLLANIRRMLHAHPRINGETVRVRFVGYAESALNVNIRVYAATREWNDFFAIREDIFLRLNDLVDEAGSGFAFPSRTLYLARDDGLDSARSAEAVKVVERWRTDGELPFPRLSRDEIESLSGTIDYPPWGSPESEGEHFDTGTEALSAEAEEADPHSGDSQRQR